MTRAAVAFPGRGAYGPSTLGSLTASHDWVARADKLRAEAGLSPLSEIDGASRFAAALHLRASNAWPLTFLIGLLDAERIADDHEVVVVVASSIGWYTALAASGALPFDDAFRLVQEMALAAEEPLDAGAAGELVYPLIDEAWERDAARREAIDAALAAAGGEAGRALELGSFSVIAGTAEAVERVSAELPPISLGGRRYPLRLAGADAWHTPLRAGAAALAAERLGDLAWQRPTVAIIDGAGNRHTPWSTDPGRLAAHSLVGHAEAPYDFARAFRVALREYAPDVVLLPGPGSTLGAPCAQLIVAEGYRGIRSRTELEAVQAGPSPLLLSVRR